MNQDLVIKFISTVGTVGSSETTVTRLDKLSRAAGKFNVMLGTSIKKNLNKARGNGNDPEPDTEDKQGDKVVKPKNTRVVEKVIKDCSPEDATLIAKRLFDLMEHQGNSDKYDQAKALFDTKKREVLTALGVDKYDLLTAEQRKMYAKMMIERKAPFKYTERSIHMKYGTNQTIYSATQRKMGTSHFSDNAFDSLVDLEGLKRSYTVSFRPVNNGSTPKD